MIQHADAMLVFLEIIFCSLLIDIEYPSTENTALFCAFQLFSKDYRSIDAFNVLTAIPLLTE